MITYNNINISLQKPSVFNGTVILYIAGMSGNALSNKLIPLEELFLNNGFGFCRFENYSNTEEFNEKTLEIFQKEIYDVIEYIKENGGSKIGIIGKSFGGGQSLFIEDESIIGMSLWAPAIGIGDEINFNSLKGKKLKDIVSIFDIKLNSNLLKNINLPVQIIHGTSDNVVPLINSINISNNITVSMLVKVDGADHSFSNNKEILYERTLNFFENL